MTIPERIQTLRQLMAEHQLDAYIIPSNDPHQSEYVAEHWKSRQWLSGFTGSAGILILTKDHAGLWTDSRYFLQAQQELAGTGVELHKLKVPHAPEHYQWLRDYLTDGQVIGMDGNLFSASQVRYLARQLKDKDIRINQELDLIKPIWPNRPALPKSPVFEHDQRYAGLSREAKLRQLRTKMMEQGASQYLVTTLDDIAWVLNLRGSDVAYNPVFIAYLLIRENDAMLYVDPEKINEKIEAALKEEAVFIKDYQQIEADLKAIAEPERLLLDRTSVSIRLFNAVPEACRHAGPNYVRPLKAIKNATEINLIRKTMEKDGVALLKLYRWLEQQLKEEVAITEFEVAAQLAGFRKQQTLYFGESFPAIVGFQGNGAIVHYRPMPDTSAYIKADGILLLDSGGQYLDGTTDITRTTALSEPTDEQKRNFTLVLKGHIALDTITFPVGTTGAQLDTLARMYLWRDGLNYGHGTGHGVGFFLSVHEPPQGFATGATTSRGSTAFEPGMLTSNEPGYYKTDAYGIRIENLVLCVDGPEVDGERFLQFETLTLFPIDLQLVDIDLLSHEEIEWLNNYHQKVYEKLAPHLNPEEKEWLVQKCQMI